MFPSSMRDLRLAIGVGAEGEHYLRNAVVDVRNIGMIAQQHFDGRAHDVHRAHVERAIARCSRLRSASNGSVERTVTSGCRIFLRRRPDCRRSFRCC